MDEPQQTATPPPPSTRQPLELGTVVQERYRVLRKLSEGGFGAVYEAEHLMIKNRVAIKCLHPELAHDAEVVTRFLREAQAAASIGHEHIVQVTDMGRLPDGAVYMVMEFLQGRNLADAVERDGPMPLGRAVRIVRQVCGALSAAHAQGIVHRDIKPENIYLVRRGDDADFVKVLDFGISKFRTGPGGENASVTRTGATIGTPHYMAPEQLAGLRDMDHRVDVYALGVVLYHVLTGHYPLDDETFALLAIKIMQTAPTPLQAYRTDLPPQLESIVQSTLAKNREQRYPSCEALSVALAPFEAVETAPVLSRPPIAPTVVGATPAYALGGGTGAMTPSAAALAGSGAAHGPSGGKVVVLGLSFLAMLGLAGGGVALYVANGAHTGTNVAAPTLPAPSVTQPPAGTATSPAAADAAAIPLPAAAPAEPRAVHVRVLTDPDDAELFLDGERVANPFDAELPVASEPRRLEARRAGYRTVIQDLVLRYAQTVRIGLRRGSGTEDRRASRPTSAASAASAPAAESTPTGPEPGARAPGSSAGAAPGRSRSGPNPPPATTTPTPSGPAPTRPPPAGSGGGGGVVVPPSAQKLKRITF